MMHAVPNIALAALALATLFLATFRHILSIVPQRALTHILPLPTNTACPPLSAVDLSERLSKLIPVIEELKDVGGSVGVSVGVLSNGHMVLDHHTGYADVERRIVANASTRYTLGSLTKSFIAATIAQLIHSKRLPGWDDNVLRHFRGLEPAAAQREPWAIGDRQHMDLSLIDILSHRTGLSPVDELWLGADGETLLDKNATVKLCSQLQPIYPVRSRFLYNNWMYALAGELIEHADASHQPWGDVLAERVLKPLGLDQTTVRAADLQGVQEALPYMVLPSKTPVLVKHMPPLQGDVMGSAGGIRSTTNDILRWGDSLLSRLSDDADQMTQNGPSVDMLFAGHSFLNKSAAMDELYGLGWAKVTMPAQFGKIGFNPGLVNQMPQIGTTAGRGHQVFYHSGAITGYNNCIFLVPRTRTVIIVMTNSIAQGDIADWIAQALLQAVLNEQKPIDLVPYAKEAALQWRSQYRDMADSLATGRRPGTHAPSPAALVGTYRHAASALYIRVFEDNGLLRFSFGGKPDQEHTLTHYAGDTFCFLPASDSERISRGLFHYSTSSWLFDFKRDANGHYTQIAWNIETKAPQPEIFTRDSE